MKEERDGDYMVELSKTLWAQHVRVAGEMAKVRAAMLEALPGWMRRIMKMSEICHICDGLTDFICERCGEPVCEDCCVVPTYMNQIDYALCTYCDSGIQSDRAEAAEREWKADEAIKTAKAIKAKARYEKYWLPENIVKRAAAKKESKRLKAVAERERMARVAESMREIMNGFRGMF